MTILGGFPSDGFTTNSSEDFNLRSLAHLADVDDVTRSNGKAVENDAFHGMRELARDTHVDPADAKLVTLFHAINEIELARLLEESGSAFTSAKMNP